MEDTLYFLLKVYLKKEGFTLNEDELKLQLLSHPSYPSLHAITGVLDHFNIDNMALEVPENKETLFQLPDNFIAHINDNHKQEFVLVTQQEKSIVLLYGDKKKKKISIDKFLTIWQGIIVVIEKEDTDNLSKQFESKTPLVSSLYYFVALLLMGFFFYLKPTIFQVSHFILSIIGIGISFFIVKHELGFHSKIVDEICSKTEATSCDAVLNSKGASISKYFKLSDISIIYFSSIVLFWLFSIILSTPQSAVVLLTIIVLPVTIYSIYYQYHIVKKWCPLCLGIVAVLWLQCCTLFFDKPFVSSIKPDLKSSFILFFSFLLTTSLWLFIKPLLKKQKELEKLEIEHYKFKRNFDLFNAVYSKGETINIKPIDSNEIVLGNKNAILQILMVTNPSCFYCKDAHTDLEKILNKNKNEVAITIRFSVPTDNDNIAKKVANKLLEIYVESKTKCKQALHEAYDSDVDLNKWLQKWGEVSIDTYNNTLAKQKDWCIENGINFTPALYVNGKQFPKEYNRSDINYFIEDLIEQEESNNNIEITKTKKEFV